MLYPRSGSIRRCVSCKRSKSDPKNHSVPLCPNWSPICGQEFEEEADPKPQNAAFNLRCSRLFQRGSCLSSPGQTFHSNLHLTPSHIALSANNIVSCRSPNSRWKRVLETVPYCILPHDGVIEISLYIVIRCFRHDILALYPYDMLIDCTMVIRLPSQKNVHTPRNATENR